MRGTRLPRTVVALFCAAVALVVAQLGWWTFFHVRFSLQQSRWQATQWADEKEAAAELIVLATSADARTTPKGAAHGSSGWPPASDVALAKSSNVALAKASDGASAGAAARASDGASAKSSAKASGGTSSGASARALGGVSPHDTDLPAQLVQRFFPRLAWGPRPAVAATPDLAQRPPAMATAGPAEQALAVAYPGFGLAVAPQAVAALRDRDRAHVRMFVFEGAFFLGLLLLGVLALLRVLRHEVGLMRQQANFLSAVTHELKSPLAVIRLFCETLQMRALEPARQASYLGTMLQEVERLDGLVANLLAVARLDAERVTVHRELIELDEAVAACLGQMRLDALPAGPLRADMVYRAPPAPLWVQCDLEALRCIVRNLLDNAIKYGQAEGRPIEVAVARAGGAATVRVTDYGRGLEPAELPRIFAKFYRVGDELVRQREGSGLGLYLARALAEAQGGSVTGFSPGLGCGTVFALTLPLAATNGGAA